MHSLTPLVPELPEKLHRSLHYSPNSLLLLSSLRFPMAEQQHIFVIARVRTAGSGSTKYRCVAAYHVMQCQGAIALCCLLRFLATMKHGSNKEVIESETSALHDKYCSHEDLPAVCCPSITFLMAMCWSTKFIVPGNPNVGYSQYSPLDENIGNDSAGLHLVINVDDN